MIGCIPQVLSPDPEKLIQNISEHSSDEQLYDLSNYETSQQLQEVSAQELIGDMLSGRTNVIDSTQTMNNTHRNVNLNIGEDETEIFSGNSELFINKEDFLRDDRGYSAVPYYKGNSSTTINLDSNNNDGAENLVNELTAAANASPKGVNVQTTPPEATQNVQEAPGAPQKKTRKPRAKKEEGEAPKENKPRAKKPTKKERPP